MIKSIDSPDSIEALIILSSISVIFETYVTLEYNCLKTLISISLTTAGLALPI